MFCNFESQKAHRWILEEEAKVCGLSRNAIGGFFRNMGMAFSYFNLRNYLQGAAK